MLSSLSILRILRLLRIFKIGRQSFIFQVVTAVIKQSRQALVLTSFVFLVATTLLATLLYLCESPLANPGVVTAVDFESVPAAAWFVLITLTTVGYGDVVPVTTAGKLIALCAVVFGIIVIAMPLAVVGTNFIVVYNIYVKATMAGGDGKDGKVGLLEKVSMIRRGSIAGSPVSFREALSVVQPRRREPGADAAQRGERRVGVCSLVLSYDRIHHTSRAENEWQRPMTEGLAGPQNGVGQFAWWIASGNPSVSRHTPRTSRTLHRPCRRSSRQEVGGVELDAGQSRVHLHGTATARVVQGRRQLRRRRPVAGAVRAPTHPRASPSGAVQSEAVVVARALAGPVDAADGAVSACESMGSTCVALGSVSTWSSTEPEPWPPRLK